MNETLYVRQADGGYQICIDMPDQSRNFLHSEVIKELWQVSEYLKSLDGLSFDSVKIIKDGKYFRLAGTIIVEETNDTALHFHSRKLNLNDAFFEKELIENTRK